MINHDKPTDFLGALRCPIFKHIHLESSAAKHVWGSLIEAIHLRLKASPFPTATPALNGPPLCNQHSWWKVESYTMSTVLDPPLVVVLRSTTIMLMVKLLKSATTVDVDQQIQQFFNRNEPRQRQWPLRGLLFTSLVTCLALVAHFNEVKVSSKRRERYGKMGKRISWVFN